VKQLIKIFENDFILFDFVVVSEKIFVKLLKYIPKGKFNQLKARFKENGGRIRKGADLWQWIFPLPAKKRKGKEKSSLHINVSLIFLIFFY